MMNGCVKPYIGFVYSLLCLVMALPSWAVCADREYKRRVLTRFKFNSYLNIYINRKDIQFIGSIYINSRCKLTS